MVARHPAVLLLTVATTLFMVSPTSSQEVDRPTATIRVVDEDGDLVDGAEARMMQLRGKAPPWCDRSWTSSVNGLISYTGAPGEYLMLVRGAPEHYAWATKVITLPAEESIQVVLPRGREVMLDIESASRTVPEDLAPIVLPWDQNRRGTHDDPLAFVTYSTCLRGRGVDDYRMIASKPVSRGNGTFAVRIPHDIEAFSVLIDRPGFIRCYEHGPIITAERTDAPVKISLPQTGAINASLRPGADHPADYTGCGVELRHIPKGAPVSLGLAHHRSETKTLDASFRDLAPGARFSVVGFTGPQAHASKHKMSRSVKLEPGATEQVEFTIYSADDDYWRKVSTASIDLDFRVVRQNGEPAAGSTYSVNRHIKEINKTITLAEGVVPEDGVVHIENMAEYEIGIVIDNELVESMNLETGGETSVHEIEIPPKKDDPAPDFEMTNLANGSSFRLSDLKGRVVLLDFWTSWCGPCQAPMKHNNELMERRRDAWKDRAVILGVSVDREIQTIRDHVEKRSWQSVWQAWVPGEFRGEAAKSYGVTGVPTAFLIDRDGRIAWRGHPAMIEVEKRIDELLGAK